MSKKNIQDIVRQSMEVYFKDLRGTEPDNLHEMLVEVIEKPLLEIVMRQADGNQSTAAMWLGINGNTLRKKLLAHTLI